MIVLRNPNNPITKRPPTIHPALRATLEVSEGSSAAGVGDGGGLVKLASFLVGPQ